MLILPISLNVLTMMLAPKTIISVAPQAMEEIYARFARRQTVGGITKWDQINAVNVLLQAPIFYSY